MQNASQPSPLLLLSNDPHGLETCGEQGEAQAGASSFQRKTKVTTSKGAGRIPGLDRRLFETNLWRLPNGIDIMGEDNFRLREWAEKQVLFSPRLAGRPPT